MHLLPQVSADGRRIVAAKTIRALGDGFASVALAAYLHERGFGAAQIGLLATSALLGTTAATLGVGMLVDRIGRRRVLRWGTGLVMFSGLMFAVVEPFWLLLLIAFLGTLNPTAGDVSFFLPIEQAALAETVAPVRRTWLYARHALFGRLAAALGALATGLAGIASALLDVPLSEVLRAMFVLYALVGLAMLAVYRPLSDAVEVPVRAEGPRPALGESRGIVVRLSALFSLDSFGGGLAVDSLIALWLFERHGLSVEATATIFFGVGLLAAGSMLLAAPLAARIGLIETMAFTHLPANVALMLMPLAPTLPVALVLLAVRSGLSQMDVAPRTTYIMSVVRPEERAAAASVTNVVRSLSTAVSPALGGALLSAGPFGLPFVVAGALKAVYDVALLAAFRRRPVRVEADGSSGR